jgi:hypothetical protein
MKRLLLLLTFFTISLIPCSAQDWKKIVPLVSTCENIKKILAVNECAFPQMHYETPNYSVSISFSTDEDEWNVSSETVVFAIVISKELKLLEDFAKDFETDLKDYKITPVGDLPDFKHYRNEKRGIDFEAQNVKDNLFYVGSFRLFPSKENSNKFKSKTRN